MHGKDYYAAKNRCQLLLSSVPLTQLINSANNTNTSNMFVPTFTNLLVFKATKFKIGDLVITEMGFQCVASVSTEDIQVHQLHRVNTDEFKVLDVRVLVHRDQHIRICCWLNNISGYNQLCGGQTCSLQTKQNTHSSGCY